MPPLTAIVSGFDCFVCGFRFWPILFAVLDEIFFGFAVSSIPQCPPHGASVMTGKRNGVASRLRAGNKTLINMCTAFAIVWHWHVAMLMTRFPTSRKQRKFYYRCGRSLTTLRRKVLLIQKPSWLSNSLVLATEARKS